MISRSEENTDTIMAWRNTRGWEEYEEGGEGEMSDHLSRRERHVHNLFDTNQALEDLKISWNTFEKSKLLAAELQEDVSQFC